MREVLLVSLSAPFNDCLAENDLEIHGSAGGRASRGTTAPRTTDSEQFIYPPFLSATQPIVLMRRHYLAAVAILSQEKERLLGPYIRARVTRCWNEVCGYSV